MPVDYSITSVPNRVTVLETRFQHYSEDLNELSNKIDGLEKIINDLDKRFGILVDQIASADKRAQRWKNVALTIVSSLTVTLIGFVAKICWIVQTNKLAGS